MNRRATVLVVRGEAGEPRMRPERLRESERRTADRTVELQRLLRAEVDLEGAIAACTAALEEVRRELRGQDARIPPIVH